MEPTSTGKYGPLHEIAKEYSITTSELLLIISKNKLGDGLKAASYLDSEKFTALQQLLTNKDSFESEIKDVSKKAFGISKDKDGVWGIDVFYYNDDWKVINHERIVNQEYRTKARAVINLDPTMRRLSDIFIPER